MNIRARITYLLSVVTCVAAMALHFGWLVLASFMGSIILSSVFMWAIVELLVVVAHIKLTKINIDDVGDDEGDEMAAAIKDFWTLPDRVTALEKRVAGDGEGRVTKDD